MTTAGRAVETLRDENGPYYIDITGGLGAGPYDRLVELGWKQVYGLNMSTKAIRSDEFVNLRAELAWYCGTSSSTTPSTSRTTTT